MNVGVFHLAAFPTTLSVVYMLRIAVSIGMGTAMAALVVEAFPTSHRATVSSLAALVGSAGSAGFLVAESFIYRFTLSHYNSSEALCFLQLAVTVLVWLLPEGKGRELDEVSPEKELYKVPETTTASVPAMN